MRLLLRVGVLVAASVYAGFSVAASADKSDFDKRLSETGLIYSLPPGFVDDGPNIPLEKELNETLDSSSPFVVHQLHSTDGAITIYVDIRVLGLDTKNRAVAIAYPIVFEANAEEYCALVAGSPCTVSTKLPASVVQADYRADFGMVLGADHPNQSRIRGHKKVSVIAVSKPSRGIFYATVAYESDYELEKGFQAVRQMLRFK